MLVESLRQQHVHVTARPRLEEYELSVLNRRPRLVAEVFVRVRFHDYV